MPKKDNSISINLFTGNRFANVQIHTAINWALTGGKFILFLTFLIVIISLLYRFSLDRKIEVLTESITSTTSSIQDMDVQEAKIRRLQKQLQIIDEIITTYPAINQYFPKLEANLPKTVTLESLTLNGLELKFQGKAPNEIVFANLLTALRNQSDFSEIVIDELQSGGLENPEIIFNIKLMLDKNNNKL